MILFVISCKELLFSCLHFVTSSDLLFRSLSRDRMQSSSVRHKLQHDWVPLYKLARVAIDHLIEKSVLMSFRSQIYLDRTV